GFTAETTGAPPNKPALLRTASIGSLDGSGADLFNAVTRSSPPPCRLPAQSQPGNHSASAARIRRGRKRQQQPQQPRGRRIPSNRSDVQRITLSARERTWFGHGVADGSIASASARTRAAPPSAGVPIRLISPER